MDEPADAYRRTTNRERYRVLHTVARRLLDDLVAEFGAERRDYTAEDPSRRLGEVPATQLIPANPGAGQLTVVFTGFPGLAVRLGNAREIFLPGCGCDACDEDPADLAEGLRHKVAVLVRTGIENSAPWSRRPA